MNADPDLDRNTGKTCLGRGMHCGSASSSKFDSQFRQQAELWIMMYGVNYI